MKQILSVVILFAAILLISCSNSESSKSDLVEEEITYTSDTTSLKGFLVYDNSIKGK